MGGACCAAPDLHPNEDASNVADQKYVLHDANEAEVSQLDGPSNIDNLGAETPLAPETKEEQPANEQIGTSPVFDDPFARQITTTEPAEQPESASKAEEAPSATEPQVKQKPWMDQKWDALSSGNLSAQEKTFFADVPTSVARRPSTVDTNFQAYSALRSNHFNELRSLEAPAGWTLKKSVESVDIYTKRVSGVDMIYTKGVTTMKTHGHGVTHLSAHLLMAEDRPKYDEVCEKGETVESYLPYYRIVRFLIKSPAAIIAPREALSLSRLLLEQDGSLLLATESCQHPLCPETSAAVRIDLFGGYSIRPTSDPDVFKVTFVVRANPNGWLPGWVKDLVAWKAQLVLVQFKKHYDRTFGGKA